jgi:hypothetical protein
VPSILRRESGLRLGIRGDLPGRLADMVHSNRPENGTVCAFEYPNAAAVITLGGIPCSTNSHKGMFLDLPVRTLPEHVLVEVSSQS